MFIEELTPVYENDRSYFENYDREPIRRLNLVIDRLNRRADAYAFRIVDTRVCLITDLVTYVIGIAEKDLSDS